MQMSKIGVEVPTELQWYRLCDLINGLPQIDWYVYQVEMTGEFMYIRAKSVLLPENTLLFIVNFEGDLL